MNARRKVLQEQDFYLKEKFEENEKSKREIIEEQRKLEEEKKDLILNAAKFREQIKLFEEKQLKYEKDRERLEKRFQEMENEKSFINSEKLKIDQSKTELRLRMQSMDTLRVKYVSTVTDNLGLNNFTPGHTCNNLIPQYNENNTMKNNFLSSQKDFNSQLKTNIDFNKNKIEYSNINDNKLSQSLLMKKSFNCDEYLNNLKVKLNNKSVMKSNDLANFNDYIYQEREYLKRSVEGLRPEKDFDLELMKETNKNE